MGRGTLVSVGGCSCSCRGGREGGRSWFIKVNGGSSLVWYSCRIEWIRKGAWGSFTSVVVVELGSLG